MSRYTRSNFYDKVNTDNIIEFDFISQKIKNFKVKRPVQYYVIKIQDIQRPDMLSLKLYGSMDYWWFIGITNQIYDWWNDIVPGNVISYPDIRDIEEWYLSNK
jgi:hypothetical protein